MFALARLVVMGFIVLSIIYVCLSLYSRAVRRSKLKAEWDEARDGDRDAFIADLERRMAEMAAEKKEG